jgi:NAD(P)-dependent dehydrogenase (short-subunit alcohol dehydrogenase family)
VRARIHLGFNARFFLLLRRKRATRFVSFAAHAEPFHRWFEYARLPGDVRDRSFCLAAVAQTISELGQLDILVNNAASQKSQESLEDITDEQWDTTFRTNIYGYFT